MHKTLIRSLARKYNRPIDEVSDLWDISMSKSKKKISGPNNKDYVINLNNHCHRNLNKMLKKAKELGILKNAKTLVKEYLVEGEMEINKTKWKIRQQPKNDSSKIFDRDASRRRREERDKERDKLKQKAKNNND